MSIVDFKYEARIERNYKDFTIVTASSGCLEHGDHVWLIPKGPKNCRLPTFYFRGLDPKEGLTLGELTEKEETLFLPLERQIKGKSVERLLKAVNKQLDKLHKLPEYPHKDDLE